VDDSAASARSVEYVSTLIAGRSDEYVHLIHVLPPESEPSARDESSAPRGGEDDARNLLGTMREQLTDAGMQADHVDTGVLTVPAKGDFVDGLLDLARDQQCSTIVVGRSSLPWFQEPFHHHPADALIKRAQGFTVWVVE